MSTPAAKAAPSGGGNLVSIFQATVKERAEQTAARFKVDGAWKTMTWQQMHDRARRQAFGLVRLGVKPGDKVALLGSTRIEWVIAELAIHMVGATSVPIYHSNTPEEVRYVADDSGATLGFVEDDAQLAKLVEMRSKLPNVRKLVRIDGTGDGDWVGDVASLEKLGEEEEGEHAGVVDERISGITPDQPACFIYTSGTTGPPKGVVLTHGNWAFEAEAVAEIALVQADDEELLFLPLAHSFAQVLKAAWLKLGHPMAFAESIDKLVENIGEVKPTVMASVPRIFEKVFTKVISGGLESPGIKGKLFRWAMGHFDRYVEARREGRDYGGLGFSLANKLVFSKVAEKLSAIFGGRIRFFISGGAPLSPKIAYFFDLAGIKILEGYGLTETSAATTVNRPEKIKIGTVGAPVPGIELKIADDGEVLIRGGGVMQGYYGLEEATKEAIDPERWFHSGDIGEIDPDGYLKITDRKKDIIVTAGGKNVAPQNLENQLKTHPLLSQVVVHGDKRKFLSALLTLDQESLEKWAHDAGVPFGSYAELTQRPEVRAEIQKAVDELNASLASYETLKTFAILDTDFTQEDGSLTPTLKVKRRVVEKRYAAILDGFYEEKHE